MQFRFKPLLQVGPAATSFAFAASCLICAASNAHASEFSAKRAQSALHAEHTSVQSDAASTAKANPGKKSSAAAEAKAARAEKKKAERAARLAKRSSGKKGAQDSGDTEKHAKLTKADSKKPTNDDAMGGSDDPLEGL